MNTKEIVKKSLKSQYGNKSCETKETYQSILESALDKISSLKVGAIEASTSQLEAVKENPGSSLNFNLYKESENILSDAIKECIHRLYEIDPEISTNMAFIKEEQENIILRLLSSKGISKEDLETLANIKTETIRRAIYINSGESNNSNS